MTKKPIDHFSLSDWRKAITEHKSPFFTLTQSEVEALVSRIELLRTALNLYVSEDEMIASRSINGYSAEFFTTRAAANKAILASLEVAK